ncbi:TetR/AcrR family transcriptional regulator [Sporosarcina sp. Te-1]|uniref:TetR/AcrR family transcriptional regulator n=1 Tax=Sporosarcina sp. Te-1 TaxID=2818390 RepID=UPI001A9EAAF6|nr:TetR/AcrR family transcriptional regulator [Sporosarcina sp. Te-1]QTD43010.1 helix-turn-helix transcriptional regulator [Sporosarcina sp. Te-1]
MKEWIPIPGTNKDTLIKVALEEFCSHGYQGVNITELAKIAEMTTGAIYHHFGSKANLYEVIRTEMEQRVIDRMEGAASLFDEPEEALQAALLTGLDAAVKLNICKLLSEELPYDKEDRIEAFFSTLYIHDRDLPVEMILISSWRSILKGISTDQISSSQGKDLIKWIFNKK